MNIEEAVIRRDHAARIVRVGTFALAALVAVLCLSSLLLILAQQARIAEIAGQAKSASDAIADCTTPKGKCYERSRATTANVVQQIIGELDRLDVQRGRATVLLRADHARIEAALRRLCAAQHITCPTD